MRRGRACLHRTVLSTASRAIHNRTARAARRRRCRNYASKKDDDDIYVMDGEVQKRRGCCGQWAECIEVHASPLCTRHRDGQWRAAPPACNAPPRRQPSPRLKHHHVT